MSAASALQTAMFLRLVNDTALTALIGADGVHEQLLTRMDRPYIRIVAIDSRDASTATEPGEEHIINLEARAGEGGSKTVQAIAARVRALLDDADLAVAGFTLVSLLHRRTRTGRDAKTKGHVAAMEFRAVTE